MDLLLIAIPVAVALLVVRRAEEGQRIRLLGTYLKKFRIEQRMEQLTDGYLRALGEADPARADAIWYSLGTTEAALQTELQQLAEDLKDVWGEHLRVSRLPVGVPQVTRFFPQLGFDFRALAALHALGFAASLANGDGLDRRDRAFRSTAELLLFQHSCHWFCRSKNLASARLQARHRTRYEQVLAAVSPATRTAYERLISARKG